MDSGRPSPTHLWDRDHATAYRYVAFPRRQMKQQYPTLRGSTIPRYILWLCTMHPSYVISFQHITIHNDHGVIQIFLKAAPNAQTLRWHEG